MHTGISIFRVDANLLNNNKLISSLDLNKYRGSSNILNGRNDRNCARNLEKLLDKLPCTSSNSSIIKMDFERGVRGVSHVFYLFGLNPRLTSSASVKRRILDILPTVFFAVVAALACLACIYAQAVLSVFYVIVDSIATYLLIGSECFLNLTVVLQMVYHRENLKNLYCKYVKIQKYLSFRVKQPIRFDEFLNTFTYQTIGIVLPLVLTVCMRVNIHTVFKNLVLEPSLVVLQLTSALVQLHIIAHVGLLNFLYTFSTKWMNVPKPDVLKMRAGQTCEAARELQKANLAELRQLKFFHFKIWEISLNINRIFGWSILAIIFRNYFEVFYSTITIYWFYMYSSDDELSGGSFMRNWNDIQSQIFNEFGSSFLSLVDRTRFQCSVCHHIY